MHPLVPVRKGTGTKGLDALADLHGGQAGPWPPQQNGKFSSISKYSVDFSPYDPFLIHAELSLGPKQRLNREDYLLDSCLLVPQSLFSLDSRLVGRRPVGSGGWLAVR
jgi:hypothetical protein